jgi:hypothetical protein
MLKFLFLIILVFPLVLTAEENPGDQSPKLSATAQAILNKAEKEIAINRNKYDLANAKVFDAAEQALKAEMEALAKAGDQAGAQKIKRIIAGMRTAIVSSVDAAATTIDNDVLLGGERKNDPVKAIAGKWRYFQDALDVGFLEFSADGRVSNPWSEPWTYTIESDGIHITPTGSGLPDPFVLTRDKNTFAGKRASHVVYMIRP